MLGLVSGEVSVRLDRSTITGGQGPERIPGGDTASHMKCSAPASIAASTLDLRGPL